jgi:hypothetical protein
MPTKNKFSNLFCLLLTVDTFTAVFKDNELSRIHKTVEIKVFLHFFVCSWKDPDPISYKPDPGDQKHKDPTGPEHC